MTDFREGQRVRLSPLGIERLWPSTPNRASFRGTFKRFARDEDIAVVHWDHRKSAATFHRDFIEAVPPGE